MVVVLVKTMKINMISVRFTWCQIRLFSQFDLIFSSLYFPYLIKSVARWTPNGTWKELFIAWFQCYWMDNFVIIQLTIEWSVDAVVNVVHHRFEISILTEFAFWVDSTSKRICWRYIVSSRFSYNCNVWWWKMQINTAIHNRCYLQTTFSFAIALIIC